MNKKTMVDEHGEDGSEESIQIIDPEEVPEDAKVLQCGVVFLDDEIIGRIDVEAQREQAVKSFDSIKNGEGGC